MLTHLHINHSLSIPYDELEITTSRSGGPGGQHVNRTDSRISVRWNIQATQVLSDEQKTRVLAKLQSQLTTTGDLVVHCSGSRSQLQNKMDALKNLADTIRKALHVPKKRMATKVPRAVKQARIESKRKTGAIKKLRQAKNSE